MHHLLHIFSQALPAFLKDSKVEEVGIGKSHHGISLPQNPGTTSNNAMESEPKSSYILHGEFIISYESILSSI